MLAFIVEKVLKVHKLEIFIQTKLSRINIKSLIKSMKNPKNKKSIIKETLFKWKYSPTHQKIKINLFIIFKSLLLLVIKKIKK
jgi:hypothetical protein